MCDPGKYAPGTAKPSDERRMQDAVTPTERDAEEARYVAAMKKVWGDDWEPGRRE
jgi:hypothetical protein